MRIWIWIWMMFTIDVISSQVKKICYWIIVIAIGTFFVLFMILFMILDQFIYVNIMENSINPFQGLFPYSLSLSPVNLFGNISNHSYCILTFIFTSLNISQHIICKLLQEYPMIMPFFLINKELSPNNKTVSSILLFIKSTSK